MKEKSCIQRKKTNGGLPARMSKKTGGNPQRPAPSPVQKLLQLQGVIGNRAVSRLIRSGALQGKFTVGAPGSIYEKEADRMADRVLTMPGPGVQRQADCPECPERKEVQAKPLAAQVTPLVQREAMPEEEELRGKLHRQVEEDELQKKSLLQRQEEPEEIEKKPLLQRQNDEEDKALQGVLQRQPDKEEEPETTGQAKLQRQPEEEDLQGKLHRQPEKEEELQTAPAKNTGTPEVTPGIESDIDALKSGGQPLPETTRSYFEPRFGADFSRVRVHNDGKAAQTAQAINAKAFTTGNHIVFNAGQYSPNTTGGKHLLAHELTHTLQQGKLKTLNPNLLSLSVTKSIQTKQVKGDVVQLSRIVDSVTMKRKDISLKGDDKYGHWWTEVGTSESYGWWPKYKVGLLDTLIGVEGELNGQTTFNGSSTQDPHHGDPADEWFHPEVLDSSKTNNQVEDEIRSFATSYNGEWRWTFGFGQNCHTFQISLMDTVGLREP